MQAQAEVTAGQSEVHFGKRLSKQNELADNVLNSVCIVKEHSSVCVCVHVCVRVCARLYSAGYTLVVHKPDAGTGAKRLACVPLEG
eukprot:1160902-Pelagomonas_calceolata.AAC.4